MHLFHLNDPQQCSIWYKSVRPHITAVFYSVVLHSRQLLMWHGATINMHGTCFALFHHCKDQDGTDRVQFVQLKTPQSLDLRASVGEQASSSSSSMLSTRRECFVRWCLRASQSYGNHFLHILTTLTYRSHDLLFDPKQRNSTTWNAQ